MVSALNTHGVSGEWVSAHAVRGEVSSVVHEVLKSLETKGWRIRRQGHKFYLYCPCGGGRVRVDGTPQNAENQARRVRREAERCPHRHDLDN